MGDDIIVITLLPKATKFQSTSPAWGTTIRAGFLPDIDGISIHVPRVGDDLEQKKPSSVGGNISIHVPRVGDDGNYAYSCTH